MAEREMELDDFQLDVPKAVGEVAPQKLKERIDSSMNSEKYESVTKTLTPSITQSLDQEADQIISDLLNTEANSAKFKDITAALNKMGNTEVNKTSALSQRMLGRSVKSIRNNGSSTGNDIGKELNNLRAKVTSLDPSQRNVFSKKGFLGFIPFGVGKRVDNYFQEYKSAETQLNDIIKALVNGKEGLMEDNAYIDEDREQMQDMMQRLEQYIYVIGRLDKKIEDKLGDIEAEDKLKAEDVKQEILFPIRQKRIDLLQHLAVSMQGYMALQVIKKNNVELIRGVDRATTTTIAALRTAITVSEALGAQKLVLDQINSVNSMTSNLIKSTSQALGEQGKEINRQATESSIQIADLDAAFKNIFNAMDSMDKFRAQALPNMKKTIDNLEATISKGKEYLSSTRESRTAEFREELAKASTDDGSPRGPVKIRP